MCNPAIDPFSLSTHEASHAVVGICLGRQGLLEWVNIVETDERKGGCKWNLEHRVEIPGEDYAIRFAGPLGQVIYIPTWFGSEIDEFQKTINQPRDRLEKWGVAGWLVGDLVPFQYLLPAHPFTLGDSPEKLTLRGIERRVRELLTRDTVASAVSSLAQKIEREREISGSVAEALIMQQLHSDDFVPRTFLLETSSTKQ